MKLAALFALGLLGIAAAGIALEARPTWTRIARLSSGIHVAGAFFLTVGEQEFIACNGSSRSTTSDGESRNQPGGVLIDRSNPMIDMSLLIGDHGLVRSASGTRDGGLFAVTVSPDDGGRQNVTAAWRSDNVGRNWSRLRTPLDSHMGVAFATTRVGYLWSATRLIMTTDGGREWTPVDVEGPLPSGSPRAHVTPEGRLLLPSTSYAGAGGGQRLVSKVWVVEPSDRGATVRSCELGPGRVVGVAGDSGLVLAVIEGELVPGVKLLSLDPGIDRCPVHVLGVWEKGASAGVVNAGRRIAVAMSSGRPGFSGNLLVVSDDNGKNWTDIKPPDLITAIGMDIDGTVWITGAWGGLYRLDDRPR